MSAAACKEEEFARVADLYDEARYGAALNRRKSSRAA